MAVQSGTVLGGAALQRALVSSKRFLGRWRDTYTRNAADDFAQHAIVESWRRAPTLRDPRCLEAFARTIVRRQRWQGLRAHLQVRFESIDADPDLAELLVAPESPCPVFAIRGRPISKAWLHPQLAAAIARLSPLNGRLLLDHSEGFSCAELADRHGLSEEAVKVRLHRSRRRVRSEIEARVERDVDAATTCCDSADGRSCRRQAAS
jgi:RNA polymerase sigma factor (sigma-70 family)